MVKSTEIVFLRRVKMPKETRPHSNSIFRKPLAGIFNLRGHLEKAGIFVMLHLKFCMTPPSKNAFEEFF